MRLIVVAVLVGSFGLMPQARSSLDVRLSPVVVPHTPIACDAHAVAQRIARGAGIPLGFEALPTCQTESSPPKFLGSWNFERKLIAADESSATLNGLTARDAFNWLVKIVPDYSWREIDGVPVVRPKEAWTDAANGLNSRVDALDRDDVRLKDVLDLVLLGELRTLGEGLVARRHFPLRFRGGTVTEALSAIVAADRARGWDAVTIERPTQWHRSTPALIVGVRVSNTAVGGGSTYVLDPAKLSARLPHP